MTGITEFEAMTDKSWTVEIAIDEHERRTRARAHLSTPDGTTLTGVGFARLSPADEDIPEIGDELAVARALVDLGHRLRDKASGDITAATREPTQLAW